MPQSANVQRMAGGRRVPTSRRKFNQRKTSEKERVARTIEQTIKFTRVTMPVTSIEFLRVNSLPDQKFQLTEQTRLANLWFVEQGDGLYLKNELAQLFLEHYEESTNELPTNPGQPSKAIRRIKETLRKKKIIPCRPEFQGEIKLNFSDSEETFQLKLAEGYQIGAIGEVLFLGDMNIKTPEVPYQSSATDPQTTESQISDSEIEIVIQSARDLNPPIELSRERARELLIKNNGQLVETILEISQQATSPPTNSEQSGSPPTKSEPSTNPEEPLPTNPENSD